MMKRLFPAVILFLYLPAFALSAYDWGLQLDQTPGAEGVTGETSDISWSGTLIPWFSTPLGKDGSLYISAGMTVEYLNKETFFIPELLHTELAWRFGDNKELKLGRIPYTDPLGFIAAGLFDGAMFTLDTNAGAFGAGLWYTGLLYKRSADITVTSDDLVSYYNPLDYTDFTGTYFAPRRLIAALDWNNPYLTERLRLKTTLIGQFELTENGERCNSQYLVLKAGIPAGSFVFDLGGAFELAQVSGETKVSLAVDLGIGWMLPTPLKDRLMFTGRLTNGTVEDSVFTAFVPVTAVSQGDILRAKLSGLSMLRLDYTAQLNGTFSFNIADSYFIASDFETYRGFPPVSSGEKDGYLLGNEFSGRLIWSPFSDLQLNLGGGIFLPSMGNSGSTSGALWRMELNAILAIF